MIMDGRETLALNTLDQYDRLNMPTAREFRDLCSVITMFTDAKALNYCINYARAGKGMIDPYEIKVQTLYILNNMTHWRGDIAKRVRLRLKDIKTQGVC